ncbi:hypothetical protein V496_00742 [Pseudogymnoascus sp. VKM F-4515 (FW-2607)]|nr:hypothetical protein V496_00742 [Pseudogymnoascus sp. VKM F-4515 (FW-2607)]
MPPVIPSRYSSLLTAASREKIRLATKRSVSATSAFSSLSAISTTREFIEAKIESLAADISTADEVKNAMREATKRKVMTEDEFNDAVKSIDAESRERERELVAVKRQKKLITDDIEEILPRYETVGDAYAEVMITRIMAATGNKKKDKPFDQKAFARAVLAYYGAKREDVPGTIEKYCHLTGWSGEKLVKCAHIVPKSLESDELSYLFGAREAVLSDPRNGLTLNRVIEGGLDNGDIVFVPRKSSKHVPGAELTWTCLLVNQAIAKTQITGSTRWKDIDGRELKFLTANRPACRYLYLRYVITLLYQRRTGNTQGVEDAMARSDAKGYIWATPGPYLRQSMLITLARKVSDTFLPEAWYSGSTFDEADGCPSRDAEAEEDLAMGFNLKIQDSFAEAQAKKKEEEEETDSEDEDEE